MAVLRCGNRRAEPLEGSIEEPLAVLAELKNRGLIRPLGVSNVTPNQLIEAQKITNIVCVQNFYNVANRHDDELIDQLAKQGIPYVPFFPLGGFTPLQSSVLDAAAASLQATPMQIALAWLLQRSSNILLIPATSSVAHLRENLAAATMELPSDAITQLDGICGREFGCESCDALRIELSMNDEFPLQGLFEPLRFVSQVQLPS